jgi:hypothetical protein
MMRYLNKTLPEVANLQVVQESAMNSGVIDFWWNWGYVPRLHGQFQGSPVPPPYGPRP